MKCQVKVIKEECEPYDYVVQETGEELILYHRWVYAPEDEPETVNRKPSTAIKSIKADADVFSQNGALVH